MGKKELMVSLEQVLLGHSIKKDHHIVQESLQVFVFDFCSAAKRIIHRPAYRSCPDLFGIPALEKMVKSVLHGILAQGVTAKPFFYQHIVSGNTFKKVSH